MAKNKTSFTTNSVHDFIAAIPDEVKRADSLVLLVFCHINSFAFM
jgi:hypothetical protein